jgi:AraC-like DNA-binding protein
MQIINFLKDLIPIKRTNDAYNKKVFDHYFFDLKYYLHKDACIEDFSFLLNIHTDDIVKITNSFYNLSFQELINENRYRHFLNELESPINANLSIDSIIKLCGYEHSENFIDYANAKRKN